MARTTLGFPAFQAATAIAMATSMIRGILAAFGVHLPMAAMPGSGTLSLPIKPSHVAAIFLNSGFPCAVSGMQRFKIVYLPQWTNTITEWLRWATNAGLPRTFVPRFTRTAHQYRLFKTAISRSPLYSSPPIPISGRTSQAFGFGPCPHQMAPPISPSTPSTSRGTNTTSPSG